ncbi:MAG TPA: CapA family protein [Chloroflexota bacterium]
MPYQPQSGDITMALAGEAMISRGLTAYREQRFLGIRDIFQQADVGYANGEMLFHNYENWPTFNSQTWMRCDPRFIKDLQWLGVNLVSCANNHGFDFGENGVLTNICNLDEAGLVHAGSGRNYAEALAPAYLETANGRVALVSATSSSRPHSRAGEQRRDMNGRPGVNLIRWVNEWTVDGQTYDALTNMAEAFNWRQRMPRWWLSGYGFSADSHEVVYLPDRNLLGVGSEDPAARFVRGSSFERHTRMFQPDVERNLQSVKDACRMADWVIFSIHNHEGGQHDDEPSEHIQWLARAVIDAGADAVIGHGPHVDRGIEIYNGRPIFYSLGNFIMQNDAVERTPQDALAMYGLGHENTPADFYEARAASAAHPERTDGEDPGPGWWSAIARVSFEGKRLRQVRLHPLEFGFGLPRSQFGRPMLAEGKIAQLALDRFKRLSEPFGTCIRIDGGTGVIDGG